jgi:rhamnosyltransferase
MIRLAILLCTHNGERYLRAQLESICSQTHKPEVLFIHDWGSRDGTRNIILELHNNNSAGFRIIYFFHAESPGACASFKTGIHECLKSGLYYDYLAFCDQDDIWHPTKIENYVKTASQAKIKPGIIFSDVDLIDAQGIIIGKSFYGATSPFCTPRNIRDTGLLLVNPVIGMTMAVARSVLADTAQYLEGPWLMHDWAVALLATAAGHQISFIDAPLVSYRQHSGNVLGAAQGARLIQRIRKARSHFGRLRQQAQYLERCAITYPGPLARDLISYHLANRFRVARLAMNTSLIRPRSRLLLAAGIIIFW